MSAEVKQTRQGFLLVFCLTVGLVFYYGLTPHLMDRQVKVNTFSQFADNGSKTDNQTVGPFNSTNIVVTQRVLNMTADNNVTTVPLKEVSRQQVYLCVNDLGRLGNLMFEVAAMLGTARRNNVTPTIPDESSLGKIFEIPYTKLKSSVYWQFQKYNEHKPCAYKSVEADFTTNITMKGYYQSWRYFKNVFPEVRKSFAFLANIRTAAIDSLINSIRSQHENISLHNLTFVGIHVRRGDMIEKHFADYGYKVGSKTYLQKAMSYFVNKFSQVMFVVCSNDMKWSQEVIPSGIATFSINQSPEVDLAILSQCNHTIMTVGSYGWWAGWLAGGITIYQRQQFRNGSGLSRDFNMTDYMLPDWIPIDEK